MAGPIVTLSIAAMLLQAAAAPAVPATCMAPTQPPAIRPIKPERPVVPSCVDEARSRHNCSARVMTDYNRRSETYAAAFNLYVAEIGAYVDTLNRYIAEVNAYTACERRAVGADGMILG